MPPDDFTYSSLFSVTGSEAGIINRRVVFTAFECCSYVRLITCQSLDSKLVEKEENNRKQLTGDASPQIIRLY